MVAYRWTMVALVGLCLARYVIGMTWPMDLMTSFILAGLSYGVCLLLASAAFWIAISPAGKRPKVAYALLAIAPMAIEHLTLAPTYIGGYAALVVYKSELKNALKTGMVERENGYSIVRRLSGYECSWRELIYDPSHRAKLPGARLTANWLLAERTCSEGLH